MSQYYVYLYWNEWRTQPYYVGQGKGNRAWQRHKFGIIRPPKDFVQIIPVRLQETAWDLEIELISKWGRKGIDPNGVLLNVTTGGPGVPGLKHSDNTKLKIKVARAQQVITDDHKRKTSLALKGRSTSVETRKKLSRALAGKKASKEARRNMSKAHLGKKHTAETLKKKSEAMKAYWAKRKASESCIK